MIHHQCDVRIDQHGEGWVDPHPSRPTKPCPGVAKYTGLFDMSRTAGPDTRARVGLCEEHAFEARYPKGDQGVYVPAVELGVLEIRSLPQDVYKTNLARAELTMLATS